MTMSKLFTAVSIMLFGLSSLAITFDRDDFSGGQTNYPPAVKPLASRSDELLFYVPKLHLAAQFPYLSSLQMLSPGRTSEKQMKPIKSQLENYLDISAETIIANSPENLKAGLRKMYFSKVGIIKSSDLFLSTQGKKMVRSHFSKPNNFSVEVNPDLLSSPVLLKVYQILALIEISQTSQILSQSSMDYRNLHPVAEMINQITFGLYIEELQNAFGKDALKSVIQDSKLPDHIKSALDFEFTGGQYLDKKYFDWKIEHEGLKVSDVSHWLDQIRKARESKNKSIKNISAIENENVRIAQEEVLKWPRTEWFRLAQIAKANNDSVTFFVIKKYLATPLFCVEIFR